MAGNISSDDDWDNVDPIVQEQVVFIMDKTIIATVTSDAEVVRDWILNIMVHNAGPLRLIMGFDVKLGTPAPIGTSAPARIALVVLHVNRSCLVFQIDYAEGIPFSLFRFLSDHRNNTLVGVGIRSKLLQLERDAGLFARGARWVDLSNLTAERYNRPELNEAGVGELRTFLHGEDVARPWPRVVDKWDAEELSYEHVRTACIDAYTCYELGSYLVYPIPRGNPDD